MFVFSGMLAFQRPDLKFVCAHSLARLLVLSDVYPPPHTIDGVGAGMTNYRRN
jgi:hypothetical protein